MTRLLTLVLSGCSVILAQQPQQAMSFFVTSEGSGKGADLGGLAGADKICQTRAPQPWERGIAPGMPT